MTARAKIKFEFEQAPTIQVSWGELIDKITILEIKKRRLRSKDAIANVRNELTALTRISRDMFAKRRELVTLKKQLRSINEALWDIEDSIRAKEAAKTFDRQFIKLARSIYVNNDKRGRLKRQINTLLGSEITEEKQYALY